MWFDNRVPRIKRNPFARLPPRQPLASAKPGQLARFLPDQEEPEWYVLGEVEGWGRNREGNAKAMRLVCLQTAKQIVVPHAEAVMVELVQPDWEFAL